MPKSKADRRSAASTIVIGTLSPNRVPAVAVSVKVGPDAGRRVMLTGRALSIGKHPSNDLVLSDPSVSSFHCRMVADSEGCRMLDNDSTNGTFVNGLRVRDIFLFDSARVELGETSLAIRFDGTTAEVPATREESFGEAIGHSLKMREAFALARRSAGSELPVLLLGETGTGKDILARAIHQHSDRGAAPFVVFNCGAVATNLIESELFGHERGSFTSAHADHVGVFERANLGTLFLNEIGELPLDLQAKLLDVFDRGSVTRVGGTSEVPVDARIIAATNRDLQGMVESGRFRSDLYYRLAVITIQLPTLRDRPEDIAPLAMHFFHQVIGSEVSDLGPFLTSVESNLKGLTHYRWPGNVRELRNVVERAAALIDPEELSGAQKSQFVELCFNITRMMSTPPSLKHAREQADREYLRDVLTAAQGDVKRAADIARVHPNSFTRLLRRYGITKA